MAGIAGTFYMEIDGVLQWATGECEFNPGVPKREAKMASFGLVGFSEEPMPASAKCKIFDRSSFDVKKLGTLEAATIQFKLANGKTWMLRDAFCTGDLTIQLRSGEIDVEFIGTAEEMAA